MPVCSANVGPVLLVVLSDSRVPIQRARHSWSWLVLCFGAVYLLAWPIIPDRAPDSDHYLDIANGLVAQVPKPFSNRILVPIAARSLSHVTHVDVETSFLAIAFVSYAAILLSLVIFANRLGMDRRLLAGFWTLPSLAATVATVYLPDLASILWSLLIFLAIAAELPLVAAILFIPAIMARETNVLLGASTILLFVWQRQYRSAAATGAAIIAGFLLTARLSAGYIGNVHEMNSVVYMLLKIPVNFVSNLLGIAFWTDSYQWCDKPAVSMPLPSFIHVGNITRIGLCRVDAEKLTYGWLPYFSVFGIGAGLMIAVWTRVISLRRQIPGVILLALGYGLLMFIIGPMSGKAVVRLTFYGWPAFLIALPYFFGRFIALDRTAVLFLIVLHVVCLWTAASLIVGGSLPFLSKHVSHATLPLIVLSVGLITNLAAFMYMRGRFAVRDSMRSDVGTAQTAA